MFTFDGSGIKPFSGTFKVIPAGTYTLKIIDTNEGKSKNGDPMITVDFKVVGGEHDGANIKFHNVTFFGRNADGLPKPGAGIAVHFLKSIGQPWENQYVVDHLKWRGRELIGTVIEDEYNGKVNNKVSSVEPHPDTVIVESTAPKSAKERLREKQAPVNEEEVPF